MMALSGSIRPAQYEVAALHLLEQAFRRNYESIAIGSELIVRLDHWHILLTAEPRSFRTDVVVSDRADGAALQERFLSEVRRWTFPGTLSTTWAESRYVPVRLR